MDVLLRKMTETEIDYWTQFFSDWFFFLSFIFLGFEFLRYILKKEFNLTLIGDTITNYLTLYGFLIINAFLIGSLYVFLIYGGYQFAVFDIKNSIGTALICIVLADLMYYWEHRFMHRVNIAWATHSVHHSSPYFNISVAYRFGPMDGVWPLFGGLILVLIGFNPVLVLFSEIIVQLYQTALHTEAVGKFPRPIETIMNTPSHHRVHHASNEEYLDTNYGGIFIIWDRLFGTFAEEKTQVIYGLVSPINSINPLTVFFHGFTRLYRTIAQARGGMNKLKYIIAPPDWDAEKIENADNQSKQSQ
ncbi:sterol desaturase family protein [Temperatibacter marinus]|uniref:Sterol desaturase family protein n=1 Tax=Temperatibacter marinus TaxID=1456591 RepID=A0AA52EGF6_9PROT|nr:sterol desaturase family protein [Temperatibacter marinus]WND01859.1 sterol desaturase family protein [Temperatibacter marinus]